MKINIVWGKYVIYNYGREDISGLIGEKSININDKNGNKISTLTINCTDRTIVSLPTIYNSLDYNFEIDDEIVQTATELPTEEEEEIEGVKISQLPTTRSLNQDDIFALSRDDNSDGTYDQTMHVSFADLVAAINPAPTFTLTVNNVEVGGDVFPANPESYQAGREVQAGITLDSGYGLVSWSSDWPELDGSTSPTLSFIMPDQNVTLTPTVTEVDSSIWTSAMNRLANEVGWGAWDPNDEKYSNEQEKTTNTNDFHYFYHSDNDTPYTSVFYVRNEFSWLKTEIESENWSNIQVDYIDESGNILQDSNGSNLSYTGSTLRDAWSGFTISILESGGGIHILGIVDFESNSTNLGSVYVAMQYDQPFNHVQVRITQIDTGSTITSPRCIVYSDEDPVFGYGI